MSSKRNHLEQNTFYFCTITCFQWLKLIEITNIYDEIYKWFDILKENNCPVTGYVIMPNHLHFLIFQYEGSRLLNTLIANGKRFLAYEIVKRLKRINQNRILNFLSFSVQDNLRQKGQKHRVFNDSFDAKICETEKKNKNCSGLHSF